MLSCKLHHLQLSISYVTYSTDNMQQTDPVQPEFIYKHELHQNPLYLQSIFKY